MKRILNFFSTLKAWKTIAGEREENQMEKKRERGREKESFWSVKEGRGCPEVVKRTWWQ